MEEGGAPPLPQTKTLPGPRREERTSAPAVDLHTPATCHDGLQHVCGSKTRGAVQGHVPGELFLLSHTPVLSPKRVSGAATQQQLRDVCRHVDPNTHAIESPALPVRIGMIVSGCDFHSGLISAIAEILSRQQIQAVRDARWHRET